MLNPYFAFGVPLLLCLLYVIFALVRKKSTLHYIGFILLLISTFMMAFSFQVLQEFWSETEQQKAANTYSPQLLWIPLVIGAILAVFNLWRGVKRVKSFRISSK